MLWNRATWKRFWHPALWSVPRDVGHQTVCHRRRPHRGPGTDAKTPRAQRGERRSIGRRFTDVLPHSVRPTRSRSPRRPPNSVAAVPVAHVVVAPPPMPWLTVLGSWLCPQGTHAYIYIGPEARRPRALRCCPEPLGAAMAVNAELPCPLMFPTVQPFKHLP
jgi:hypothetical protein